MKISPHKDFTIYIIRVSSNRTDHGARLTVKNKGV